MKKRDKIALIIRSLIMLVIIYFVYKETGIATTIFALLTSLYIEVSSLNRNN